MPIQSKTRIARLLRSCVYILLFGMHLWAAAQELPPIALCHIALKDSPYFKLVLSHHESEMKRMGSFVDYLSTTRDLGYADDQILNLLKNSQFIHEVDGKLKIDTSLATLKLTELLSQGHLTAEKVNQFKELLTHYLSQNEVSSVALFQDNRALLEANLKSGAFTESTYSEMLLADGRIDEVIRPGSNSNLILQWAAAQFSYAASLENLTRNLESYLNGFELAYKMILSSAADIKKTTGSLDATINMMSKLGQLYVLVMDDYWKTAEEMFQAFPSTQFSRTDRVAGRIEELIKSASFPSKKYKDVHDRLSSTFERFGLTQPKDMIDAAYRFKK